MNSTVVRLAFLVEPDSQLEYVSLEQARIAALPLNAVRASLGLPPLTHVCVYIDGARVAIRPLDPSAGA